MIRTSAAFPPWFLFLLNFFLNFNSFFFDYLCFFHCFFYYGFFYLYSFHTSIISFFYFWVKFVRSFLRIMFLQLILDVFDILRYQLFICGFWILAMDVRICFVFVICALLYSINGQFLKMMNCENECLFQDAAEIRNVVFVLLLITECDGEHITV